MFIFDEHFTMAYASRQQMFVFLLRGTEPVFPPLVGYCAIERISRHEHHYIMHDNAVNNKRSVEKEYLVVNNG